MLPASLKFLVQVTVELITEFYSEVKASTTESIIFVLWGFNNKNNYSRVKILLLLILLFNERQFRLQKIAWAIKIIDIYTKWKCHEWNATEANDLELDSHKGEMLWNSNAILAIMRFGMDVLTIWKFTEKSTMTEYYFLQSIQLKMRHNFTAKD